MLPPNIDLQGKTILVTGAAGFIGSNLVKCLLNTYTDIHVVGIDNMNAYYDVTLKEYRLQELEKVNSCHPCNSWSFIKGSISDRELINKLFVDDKFDIVVNLAAQAGKLENNFKVRY